MNNLDVKYDELKNIFKITTIEYLKSNGYKFDGNLHEFTLQSLIDDKYSIFQDLILNGIYDDNYDVNIISSHKNNHNNYYENKYNLLDVMGEKKYTKREYYCGIINSNKKYSPQNQKNTNGSTWLYNAIQLYELDEKIIIDIIKYTPITIIYNSYKKTYKFFKKLFQKNYDELLYYVLTNMETINILENIFIELVNNNVLNELNNFIKSNEFIFKIINCKNVNINSSNCFFYLEATKKNYLCDYKNFICSDYIYNNVINILAYDAIDYYIENDIMLAKEIFEYINLDLDIKYFKQYTEDVLKYNLIKLYSNVCEGKYKYDYIIHINNAIKFKYELNVGYKDIEDFTIKIESIISRLAQISNIKCNILKYFSKSIEVYNSEFCELILSKHKKSSLIPILFKYIEHIYYDDIIGELEKYSNSLINKKIIIDCLDNNMDNLIIMLIESNNIQLFKYNSYYDTLSLNLLYGSFLELIFKKQKVSLIKKIIDNEKIIKNTNYGNIYTKKLIINYCLFLGLYYNLNEIVYHLIENFSHCIDMSIFVFDINIITSSNIFNDNQSIYEQKKNFKINSPYIKTSGLELIVKNISKYEYIMDYIFNNYIGKLPHYLIDNEKNSLFTLLIKYNLIKYLKIFINIMGKNIFMHIPMMILNNYNISHIHKLSNGLEFYWACKNNLLDIADFLIDNKLGKINSIDLNGNHCLIYACKNKMNIVAEKIIRQMHPLHINQTNSENKCAYEYAKSNGMEKICQMINDINIKFSSSKSKINVEEPIVKIKISSNPLETNPLKINPFENSNLKNNELIKLTEWIKFSINK